MWLPTVLLASAACAQSGLLARRGFAVARVCRESRPGFHQRDGSRPGPTGPTLDGRRLEVVAEGLLLFGGMQLAIDATLVSPLHCDGTVRPGAAHIDGVALQVAQRRKERTCLELVLFDCLTFIVKKKKRFAPMVATQLPKGQEHIFALGCTVEAAAELVGCLRLACSRKHVDRHGFVGRPQRATLQEGMRPDVATSCIFRF